MNTLTLDNTHKAVLAELYRRQRQVQRYWWPVIDIANGAGISPGEARAALIDLTFGVHACVEYDEHGDCVSVTGAGLRAAGDMA